MNSNTIYFEMKLIIHTYDLKLKHKFKIAHDSREVQKTLIVELNDDAISGFGESTVSNYYKKPIDSMIKLLESKRNLIESYVYQKPELFWEKLKLELPNSFVLSAVDVAINDLYAKSKGKTLKSIWGLSNNFLPISNYTIGIDTIEIMAQKIKEFPWPKYKIKLGTKEDVKIIKELRKITDAVFRVDVNCGWTVDETLRNAKILKTLNVEFIEQPLAADNWDGMNVLYKSCQLPIIADESCIGEAEIAQCEGHFHGVNIKLMKCGGFTPARRMIADANARGMKVMAGCMTESSVGISAVAQLLPMLDYVDMDGFLLLENDIANGPKLLNNKIVIPQGPGIGVNALFADAKT